MDTSEIISAINAEIAKLQQVRAILTTMPQSAVKRGPGRPKLTHTLPKKRTLSDEARARIAAAQRRRWAATKNGK